MYRFGKAKNRIYLLAYKQQINEKIKHYKGLLKKANKELSKAPKPLDIYKLTDTFTTPEEVEYVRKSPEIVKHIEKAFSEFESGPFKGWLCWHAHFMPAVYFKDHKPRLLVTVARTKESKTNLMFSTYNRINAYHTLWISIIDNYPGCYFEIGV
jgi:hypothetical protein